MLIETLNTWSNDFWTYGLFLHDLVTVFFFNFSRWLLHIPCNSLRTTISYLRTFLILLINKTSILMWKPFMVSAWPARDMSRFPTDFSTFLFSFLHIPCNSLRTTISYLRTFLILLINKTSTLMWKPFMVNGWPARDMSTFWPSSGFRFKKLFLTLIR